MKNENLVSIAEYAMLCDVTRAAIYTRIKNGDLKAEKANNGKYEAMVIDKKAYPPTRLKPGREKFTY